MTFIKTKNDNAVMQKKFDTISNEFRMFLYGKIGRHSFSLYIGYRRNRRFPVMRVACLTVFSDVRLAGYGAITCSTNYIVKIVIQKSCKGYNALY